MNGTKWIKIKGGTELEWNEKNPWNDYLERSGKIEYRSNGLLTAIGAYQIRTLCPPNVQPYAFYSIPKVSM